jgi:ferredoxin-NADP reductase
VQHDRGYHRLRIARVVRETDEACSLVLEIPDQLRTTYGYAAGQFLTFRLAVDGETLYRSYSMSSAPETDAELAVTVKRVPGGAVSNRLCELRPGDEIDASAPAGKFRLPGQDRAVVAFAAGSGITPIYSLIKSAMVTTSRSVRLLYANRDPDSVIFRASLDAIARERDGRLEIRHRFDVDEGYVDAATVQQYVASARDADVYVCGPAPFMDVVESTLLTGGVPADRIHIERFTSPETASATDPDHVAELSDAEAVISVTIELDGQTATAKYHPGATILQTARQLGMKPPSSCEAGNCATCMAKLVQGEVTMRVNDALFDDEVADGWILTCQSEPVTAAVHVVYGYEEK